MAQAVLRGNQDVHPVREQPPSAGNPDEGDNDLAFLEDPVLQEGTGHQRQAALLFWSHSPLTRSASLKELSDPARFYEKHTIELPLLDACPEDAPAAPAGDSPLFEEPAAPAPSPAGGTGDARRKQACSPADPLEDLYEQAGTGPVPAREQSSAPDGDLYAVIMRLSANRKQ